MKKLLSSMTILVLVAAGCAPLFAQSPTDAKFQKIIDNYLDNLWKFSPTAATMAGFYKYNDKLEDLSPGTIEKRLKSLDAFNQELVAKTDMTKLTADNQVIYNMIRDAVDLELVKFENLVPWEYNPLFYNSIFINSIRSLLIKDFAPLDARLKSVAERAKLLPGLVKRAKDNLKTPPQIYTETAIKQMPAIIDFYQTEVPVLVGEASAKAAVLAEIAKAIASLEDYQRFLQNDLLPKSTGNFRLGDQTHLRMLRMLSQGNIPIQELADRAKADYINIRKKMVFFAAMFHEIMYPDVDLSKLGRSEEETKDLIIPRVLNKLRNEHPLKEEYIAKISATASAVKDYFTQTKLIDPPGTELKIVTMPAVLRGMMMMNLVSPGAYESDGGYEFQIAPIPDDWSNDQVTSYLEEYNNYYLPIYAVQKIYPGSFLPTVLARKDPSIIKKLYANQAILKGWPVFFDDLLTTSGYGNYDPRLVLNVYEMILKNLVDFQCELNIHQGGLTKEQAIRYMTLKGYMTPAEAEERWNHILLNPCDAALTYIGYQEIKDLEKDYSTFKKDAYNRKEFLQKLFSWGAISIRDIKSRLLQ